MFPSRSAILSGNVFENNYSLLLDGTNEVIALSSPAAIDNIWSGGGTISCRLYPTGLSGASNSRIFDKSKTILYLQTLSGGTLKIGFFVDFDSTDGSWISDAIITTNQWNHFVITYNDGHVDNNPIIYIDGVQYTVGAGITETTPVGSVVSDAGDNGFWGNNGDGNRGYLGNMDELAVYSRILTPTEVAVLYNQGTPSDAREIESLTGYWRLEEGSGTNASDSSTNSNAGTLTNMEAADWVAY